MENEERDWFTQGWADDGGVVSDGRESEAMPKEAESGAEGRAQSETGGAGAAFSGETREEGPGETAAEETPSAADPSREADFVRFVTEYPEVDAKDIPREVWQRVAAGDSLVTAYARYEARALREENRRIRQTQENRRRSAGSQLGAGSGARRFDAFESGWEDAY